MAESARLLEAMRAAAARAGAAILEIYARPFAVERKADASPVTRADELAEAIILEALRRASPAIPIIAEELCASGGVPASAPERFWLVDPLDGTKEFIARNGEFTVNIALIERTRPVLGVVLAPAQDVAYWAIDGRAWRQRGGGAAEEIAARKVPDAGAVVLHSRSHADETKLDAYIAALPQAQRRVSGSSIKFCLLAAGEADLYPRFGRTMEWDTAAGQAVLEAAGGSVTILDGARLDYGKPGFENPDFIARGR
ncbi:MAG TPA: 3'(2'),5'-bisphosphate nucleotidase CysQ [Stellaceae bacterium]|nr:3'(2'),5'-bisphosphate nucleotidase CysQ [Stellaceae bacterium]